MYRRCVFCGKYFEPNNEIQKYCSVYCRSKSYRWKRDPRASPPPIKKICAVCGAEFIPVKCHSNQQKYCSFNCAWEVIKKQKREAYRRKRWGELYDQKMLKVRSGIRGDARESEVLQLPVPAEREDTRPRADSKAVPDLRG